MRGTSVSSQLNTEISYVNCLCMKTFTHPKNTGALVYLRLSIVFEDGIFGKGIPEALARM